MPRDGNIAVLETKSGAHSGYFLEYLANGWHQSDQDRELQLILPPDFARKHPDSHDNLRALSAGGKISVHLIPDTTWAATTTVTPPLRPLFRLPVVSRHLRLRSLYWKRWLAVRKAVQRLQPTAALVMSLDDLLAPILLTPPHRPIRMSGILFKPSFHYPDLPHHELRSAERVRSALELRMVRRFLERPDHQILSLDPFAVEQLRSDFGARVETLPEPARSAPPDQAASERLKQRLGIAQHRRTFLLLGALAARRGVHEVLAAVRGLRAEEGGASCILLAGTVNSGDRQAIDNALADLRHSSTAQVVLDERRIPEEELMDYFHLADTVLVTHRHHVGSSGTLLHAAAAGRPVIATRNGLIGELTRRHRLGVTVDSSAPRAIADAIRLCLTSTRETLFDPRAAAALAAKNTPQRYANVLINALTSDHEP